MTIRARGRLAAVASGLVLALVAAGCTAADPGDDAGVVGAKAQENQDSVVLAGAEAGIGQIGGNPAEMALKASEAFFEKAPAVVVLGNDGGQEAAAGQARALGVPLLVAPGDAPDEATERQDFSAELERLGARTLIAHGTVPDSLAGSREVVEGAASDADLPDIDPVERTTDSGFAVVVRSGEEAAEAAGPALVTAQAAGAELHTMASPDPRAAKNQKFFQEHADSELYAIGGGFGKAADFSALAATAAGGMQLPGGGQIVFPDRRMVALYGTPGTASLGLLGEQDVDGAIKLAKKYAAEYQPFSKEKVVPAFEIISTVAAASAGKDGKYSSYVPVERLESWVKAAEKAGVYVVLDLQPGRNDFLTQAKHYEKLLVYPNVGIAYDPEWRLKPGQRHMVQIGSVDAAELNRTNDWLAALTRKHHLPQKVVILHQFKLSMIRNRSALDTSHPELAMVLHADGNGTPGMKMETWKSLRRDLPDGIRMAWKNFIDEDSPTFTPKQTFDIDPKPWFVSYQ
ncbi:hypothetical protein Q2T94_00885 [Paeniglutamicibacter sulfureus]|uniref:hypothetical protein n=1 Tax=Paeniglutamicibacter sulfureus TaxID=43666 RepID=UPI002666537F|nr:hypothetical protein [Paeniglutamicibacter sulfureus]MDO2932860.1 hypothetical protein [Paeniglutamicibacter sulfureus]